MKVFIVLKNHFEYNDEGYTSSPYGDDSFHVIGCFRKKIQHKKK